MLLLLSLQHKIVEFLERNNTHLTFEIQRTVHRDTRCGRKVMRLATLCTN